MGEEVTWLGPLLVCAMRFEPSRGCMADVGKTGDTLVLACSVHCHQDVSAARCTSAHHMRSAECEGVSAA